jgi:hypothetical protein
MTHAVDSWVDALRTFLHNGQNAQTSLASRPHCRISPVAEAVTVRMLLRAHSKELPQPVLGALVMLLSRRALSCAAAGALLSPFFVLAVPALADTPPVSGITIDSLGSDGVSVIGSTAMLSPTYSVSVKANGLSMQLQTLKGAATSSTDPIVRLTPPTGSAELAVQDYATAETATDSLAGLEVYQYNAPCSTSNGTLSVHDIAYTAGVISRLSATYSYRCSTAPDFAYGELRIASTDGVVSANSARSFVLGTSQVGTPLPAKTVQLRNNGTLPFTFGQVGVDGANSGDFALTADPCSGVTLQPATSCNLTVTSTPSAPGARSARVTVPVGTARGTQSVLLTATGTAPPTPPSAPVNVQTRTASNGVQLTWEQPDLHGSSIVGYDVYRGTSASDLVHVATVDTFDTSYGDALSADTALATTYTYAVTATNGVGTGPQSDPVAGTTPATDTEPTTSKLVSFDGAHEGAFANTASLVGAAADKPLSFDGNPNRPGGGGGSPPVSFRITPLPGSALSEGSFPIASVPDATHVGFNFGAGYLGCNTYAGSLVLNAVATDVTGAMVILDADVSFTCDGQGDVQRLAIRIGSDRVYTAVTTVGVDAGTVPVGAATTHQATYTNSGTTPVTVSGATVTAPNGTASADFALASGSTCVAVTLAPGSSCFAAVTAAPSAAGRRFGSVTFTDSTPTGTRTRDLRALGQVVPVAPTAPSVTRSGGRFTLAFSDAGAESQRADSYQVLKGADADHLALFGTVPSAGYAPASFTDPGTEDGLRTYAVRAVNAAGVGPQVLVTVDAGLRAPVLEGGSNVTRSVVTIVPSAAVPSDPVTGYRLYRGISATALTALPDTTTLTLTAPAPASGQHVYYAVSALVGSTIGPRSAVLDVVGPTTQLITAGIVGGPSGSSSPVRVRGTSGASVQDLSSSSQLRTEVAVSPNGLRVAYVEVDFSGSSVTSDIWLRSTTAGGASTRLTSTQFPKAGLAWSPDGTKLAYTSLGAPGTPAQIQYLQVASGNPFAYTGVPSSSDLGFPSWLDSNTIVAEQASSESAPLVKVIVSGAGAGTRIPLAGTDGAISASVRPDGTEVAFLFPVGADGYDLLKVLNLTSGQVRTLMSAGSSYLSTPSWTRDGATVYTTSNGHIDSVPSAGGTSSSVSVGTGEDIISVGVSTPDSTPPTAVKLGGVPATTLAASITPSFSATDALNGIGSYTVSYRKAAYNTGFGAVTSFVTRTPKAIPLTRGFQYCVSVKATDRVGNISPATPEQCTTSPLDDRALTHSAGFAAVKSGAYYLGTAMRATASGQSLSRTGVTSVKQLYLLVTTCRTCGVVDVFIGSARVARVNTASTGTVNQKLIALPVVNKLSGTVSVKVVGSGKQVFIDGLGFRK